MEQESADDDDGGDDDKVEEAKEEAEEEEQEEANAVRPAPPFGPPSGATAANDVELDVQRRLRERVAFVDAMLEVGGWAGGQLQHRMWMLCFVGVRSMFAMPLCLAFMGCCF